MNVNMKVPGSVVFIWCLCSVLALVQAAISDRIPVFSSLNFDLRFKYEFIYVILYSKKVVKLIKLSTDNIKFNQSMRAIL